MLYIDHLELIFINRHIEPCTHDHNSFVSIISDCCHTSMRIKWCQQEMRKTCVKHLKVSEKAVILGSPGMRENRKISSCNWKPIRS